jgi:phosphoglycolate phosphatase-like HAD superfamily hydrolase
VLPDRQLVTAALARLGIQIDASAVPRAHYATVHRLDRSPERVPPPDAYFPTLCRALGVSAPLLAEAVRELSYLGDRQRSGEILWGEPTPHARHTIGALQRSGMDVIVVTNSDGHAAENLRDVGLCGAGGGAGIPMRNVIDSALVDREKPDPDIFQIALERAQLEPDSVVHVGDTLSFDIAGARAAGIAPIHLDPYRTCRANDHRHIRSLNGIWRHLRPLTGIERRGR